MKLRKITPLSNFTLMASRGNEILQKKKNGTAESTTHKENAVKNKQQLCKSKSLDVVQNIVRVERTDARKTCCYFQH